MTNNFALIAVDVLHGHVDRLFHYALPEHLLDEVSVGKRVRVPFGQGDKVIIGYVTELTHVLPEDVPFEKIKSIHSVCEDFPVLRADTLELARWMRDKYYTTLAACIRTIIPGVKADGGFHITKRAARKTFETSFVPDSDAIILTSEQESALAQITDGLSREASPPVLLYGVTGSGKTEVYLRAIEKVLALGKQAVVLVPEIALTPQMVGLFTARFGDGVAVTHSRMSPAERFRIWKRAVDGELELIIGPRSAVFTPFENLGLIVIDEEHEHSYHSETAPKYDTRTVAIKRAELSGALVVLGSATPGLETFFRTQEEYADYSKQINVSGGEYAIAKLSERVNKTLPEITVLDMRREMARGNLSMFAAELQDALGETIEAGRQAILFLNRRGHSSFVSCRWCGNVLSCDHCRVNYTYHADKHRLLCHYCGKGMAMPSNCPACDSMYIHRTGTGTQKVEEEVSKLFPHVTALRMDMDTTKGKYGHAKILDAFREEKAQVLIGTQMVAKGLDFPKVTMVGVIAADNSLFTGDFRAGEYTFQLLTQVSGRAGRAKDPGRVFIQTYNPEHYAITFARENNFDGFYAHEMTIRRALCYPPFSHVFAVMITGPKEIDVINALRKLAAIMEYSAKRSKSNTFELIGLSPAFVSMIKKQFRWKLLVKCVRESPLVAFVLYCIKKLRENDPLTGLSVHLTLNPIMME